MVLYQKFKHNATINTTAGVLLDLVFRQPPILKYKQQLKNHKLLSFIHKNTNKNKYKLLSLSCGTNNENSPY